MKFISLFFGAFVSAEIISYPLKKRSSIDGIIVQKVYGDLEPFNGDIEIGTPGQTVTVSFDSGSYSANVQAVDSVMCSENDCPYGTYNISDSSTSILTDEEYYVPYLDGETYGFWSNDTLLLGNSTIEDFYFGYTYNSTDSLNVFGIGYNKTLGGNSLDVLTDRGVISKRLINTYYSTESQTGGVVFGGLDSSKYSGSLELVSMEPTYGYTYVSAIGTSEGIITSDSFIIKLDTGSTASMLVPYLYHQIHQGVGASLASNYSFANFFQPDGSESYVFKCSSAKDLKVWFHGKELTLFASSYALVVSDSNGDQYYDNDGDAICVSSFFSGSLNLLGGYQIKDLFIVFDYEEKQFAFAQSCESSSEDLIVIDGMIPDAVTAVSYSGAINNVGTTYSSPFTTKLSAENLYVVGSRYTGTFATDENTESASDSSFDSNFDSVSSLSSCYSSSVPSITSDYSNNLSTSSEYASSLDLSFLISTPAVPSKSFTSAKTISSSSTKVFSGLPILSSQAPTSNSTKTFSSTSASLDSKSSFVISNSIPSEPSSYFTSISFTTPTFTPVNSVESSSILDFIIPTTLSSLVLDFSTEASYTTSITKDSEEITSAVSLFAISPSESFLTILEPSVESPPSAITASITLISESSVNIVINETDTSEWSIEEITDETWSLTYKTFTTVSEAVEFSIYGSTTESSENNDPTTDASSKVLAPFNITTITSSLDSSNLLTTDSFLNTNTELTKISTSITSTSEESTNEAVTISISTSLGGNATNLSSTLVVSVYEGGAGKLTGSLIFIVPFWL